ncbi:unnamed protein product [Ranitomeya imitator]|uniref:BZIP domain-containing protein n=1 Tax=Ranitomeya imitator TaxID=111125 RepID=A0ABN9LND0_9NEOB|nr:unnamed protein product [Ranitomeya imitator]
MSIAAASLFGRWRAVTQTALQRPTMPRSSVTRLSVPGALLLCTPPALTVSTAAGKQSADTGCRRSAEKQSAGDRHLKVMKTSLNRCHTHRFSDVCRESSDERKFWPSSSDQRHHSRILRVKHNDIASQDAATSRIASDIVVKLFSVKKQEDKLGYSEEPYGYSYLHNDNGKTDMDEEVAQSGEEGDPSNTGASDSHDIGAEIDRNTTEPSLFFEEFIQLLAQTENALENMSFIIFFASYRAQVKILYKVCKPSSRPGNSVGELWQDFLSLPDLNITLEDIQSMSNTNNAISTSGPFSAHLTETISQDISLPEAMFASPTARSNEDQGSENLLLLNSSAIPEDPLSATNLTNLFPATNNNSRNSTNQDLFSGLDENVFDEINLMSLALEEGFDPLEVSQLFEEPDSDSGLSLNSSHSPTSASISDTSSITFGEEEGAAGYSSDSESTSYDGLEGAVGGSGSEINKFCQIDDSDYYSEMSLHNVHHNHTYNQLPDQVEPSPEHHYSWSVKSSKIRSPCVNAMDKSLSRDERRAKSLKIPFSVEEIVSMPVEMFNSMLSKHYLTETQVSIIRDIRRRGKNKVAAQNCRKRKLDVILNLEDDVNQLKVQKEKLLKEQAQCSKSMSHMKQKLNDLYRDVFNRLRDEQGRPVNPNHYALHCNSDGSIMVVPRRLFKSEPKKDTQKDKKQK